jgi:hypothetical protein
MIRKYLPLLLLALATACTSRSYVISSSSSHERVRPHKLMIAALSRGMLEDYGQLSTVFPDTASQCSIPATFVLLQGNKHTLSLEDDDGSAQKTYQEYISKNHPDTVLTVSEISSFTQEYSRSVQYLAELSALHYSGTHAKKPTARVLWKSTVELIPSKGPYAQAFATTIFDRLQKDGILSSCNPASTRKPYEN